MYKNEKVLAEVRKEAEKFEGLLPTWEELTQLSYSKAVINETLRLYPTAASHPLQSVDDTTLLGYNIPKGATVMYSIYITQRPTRLSRKTSFPF